MQKKVKKVMALMVLAFIMAVLPICCLPISVFAGSDDNDLHLSSPEITISNVPTSALKRGDEPITLTATTQSKGTVTWESSDANVATVDGTGKVTAVGPGEATITVTETYSGGSATETCNVMVKGLVGRIGVSSNNSVSVFMDGTLYGYDNDGKGSFQFDYRHVALNNGQSSINTNEGKVLDISDLIGLSADGNVVIKDTVVLPEGEYTNVESGVILSFVSGSTFVVEGALIVESTLSGNGTIEGNGNLIVNGTIDGIGTLSVYGTLGNTLRVADSLNKIGV